MIEAYPLTWPMGWPRTDKCRRVPARFMAKTFARARDGLLQELGRYGARDIVVSTHLPLRRDGIPYSGLAQPEDVGVAVYFSLRKNQKETHYVFACDKYNKIEDNMHAICKTVEAMRGIERWGTSELLQRAFTGFQALPVDGVLRTPYEILGIVPDVPWDTVVSAWRDLIKQYHPDKGGDTQKAQEINTAFAELKTIYRKVG